MAHRLDPAEKTPPPDWPLLAEKMKTYPDLWTAGWKLSHILPCSPQPGDRLDPLTEMELRDEARFHYLRTLRNLSPFNYFVSPMPRRFAMTLDGRQPYRNDLGEAPEVIDWVVKLLHEEVFATHPAVQAEFTGFLREAGGQVPDLRSPRGQLTVTIHCQRGDGARRS